MLSEYEYFGEPMCLNCGDMGCDYCEGDAPRHCEEIDTYGDDGQPTEYEEWQDLYGGDDMYDYNNDCEYGDW